MAQNDYFQTPHGPIYWEYQNPEDSQDQKPVRPTLLFIHAGVADRTLWDEQVSYFVARGWGVLRYDIFGYGLSKPNADYLESDIRPKVKHHEHAASIARNLVAETITTGGSSNPLSRKYVAIGLSRGGGIATELTVAYPDLICGLVIAAGAVTGIDAPNKPEEDALLGQWFMCMQNKEIEQAATIFTRYWGDGPLVEGMRLKGGVRAKLYAWIKDITQREADRTGGGFCIPFEGTDPPAADRLSSIQVPVATATGNFDETSTTGGMRKLIKELRVVSDKDFETAHMINLEEPQMFNAWVEDYLHRFILGR